MGGPIIILTGGNYSLGIWEFTSKDSQIIIMQYDKQGNIDYHDTIYPNPGESCEDLLYVAINWLKSKGINNFEIK